MHKTFVGAVAIIVTMTFATASVSYGQNSSVETYGGEGGSFVGNVAGGSPSGPGNTVTPSSSASAGGLPFTGLDVGLVVGGGMLLVLSGLMAWLASKPDRSNGDL